MASETRYARVDSAAQSDAEVRPSAEPLQYSSSLPDLVHTPKSPHRASWTSKKSFFGRAPATNSGIADDLPPYRDYVQVDLNGERPGKPKRVRTTGSIVTVASSAWRSTRDFAVSSFNVPQIGAPWEHKLTEKTISGGDLDGNTVREFDYRRQRSRLFINSTFQLLVTLIICAALAGALYGFSTIVTGLSQTAKKAFNALITGLSIILGLNLASSLTGYAQMMRWRFLASSYRSLQDFELVMQCESQSKVFRLLWAGRTRGQLLPNKTQVLAFVWLGINVALQVATALLGLTYSIDISADYIAFSHGNVSVADIQNIVLSTSEESSYNTQREAANSFGISGQDYGNSTSTLDAYTGNQRGYFQNAAMTEYWYTFIDQNPLKADENVITWRKIVSTATCRSHKVTFGGYAGWDYKTDAEGRSSDQYLHYLNSEGKDTVLYVQDQASGSTTWLSHMNQTCGDRCNIVFALQSVDNITVYEPALFQCNNTVSHVYNWDWPQYGIKDVYDLPDAQARIMAGSIGWSGTWTDGYDYQSHLYPPYNYWSPYGGVSELDVARLLMEFSTGAFAALDYNGQRTNVPNKQTPGEAQVVNVEWKWTVIVLAVIPATQALVLICVVGWANKAIIKDTSFLGTARLLAPVVNRLGDRGCLLTGDEIAEELGNYRIIYGPRFPSDMGAGGEDSVVKHIDVIAEEEDKPKWRGRMPAGRYDGMTTWKEKEEVSVREVEVVDEREKRKRGRRLSV